MTTGIELLQSSLLGAWRTNNRVTTEFVKRIPKAVWEAEPPGVQRRPIRAIAAHLHNARCWWIKMLGQEHGIAAPERVDFRTATPREVAAALGRSSAAMEKVFALGFDAGGEIPPSKRYVWRNLALDVGHVVTYFIAHEAHHRGQIIMVARQTGHRLPPATSAGLWQWKPPAPKKRRTAR